MRASLYNKNYSLGHIKYRGLNIIQSYNTNQAKAQRGLRIRCAGLVGNMYRVAILKEPIAKMLQLLDVPVRTISTISITDSGRFTGQVDPHL